MKRKILAIILSIIFIFTITGCSSNEIGFFNTMKNIMKLDNFTFEGEISLNINELSLNEDYDDEEFESSAIDFLLSTIIMLPGDLTGLERNEVPSEDEYFDFIKQTYSGTSLVYDGLISKKDDTISFNLSLKNKDGISTNLFRILLIDRTLCFSRDLVEKYFPELKDLKIVTFENIEYAEFSIEEVANIMADIANDGTVNGPTTFVLINEDDYTEDYLNGYYAGYDIGSSDGYYQEEENNIPDTTDVVATDMDEYIAGYVSGYDDGYFDGFDDYQYEQDSINEINSKRDWIIENFSVSNILEVIQNVKGISLKTLNEFVVTLFKDCEFGVIQKDGDNKYKIDFDSVIIYEAIDKAGQYLLSNPDNVGLTLKAILNNLTTEELKLLSFPLEDKELFLEKINNLIENDDALVKGIIEGIMSEISLAHYDLSKAIDLNYSLSLDKTGAEAYDVLQIFSLATKENKSPVNFDIEVSNSISINKDLKGVIKAEDASLANSGNNNAQILINIEDENAIEGGIIYSASSDFKNPIIIKGIKQSDNKYKIDLSQLSDNTKYYYKTYTKDEGQNILYSTVVKEFSTLANPTENPATFDNSNILMLVFLSTLSFRYIYLASSKRKLTE